MGQVVYASNSLCCCAETDSGQVKDQTPDVPTEQQRANLSTQPNADAEHVVLNIQYGESDQHPAQPHQHQPSSGNQHQQALESRSAQHLRQMPPEDEQQPAVTENGPQQVMHRPQLVSRNQQQQPEQNPISEQQRHQPARGEGERVQLHDSADSREAIQQQQLPRSLSHAHGSRSGRQEVGLA